MPATDSELASMEEPNALEDVEGSSTNIPSSVPPPTVPSSPPPPEPTTTRPNFPTETVIEKKAVSMASNDCSSALSSPAEASPAKPAAPSPTTFEGSVETSPATSHIASASDSLTCTGTSLVNISELPLSSVLPPTTFGDAEQENDFPAVLTFKGVSVTLENNSVWKQFYSCGTEMILTKQGRRMFPYCRYRLAGLNPKRQYNLVLSIVPSDQHRYRWSSTKWEVTGRAEHQAQGLIRAFSHHYSPCCGADWMGSLVSFYKLKLTNNFQDQDGHIPLHSMHRYIPRLHVIPVPDGDVPTPDQPVVMGPECMTFTFPQTEFMAVTTYQNFRITQLKINHNPFAKGFREDGNNPRLKRVTTEAQFVAKTDTQPSILKLAEVSKNKAEVVDLSTKNPAVPTSLSNEQETRLVLKPIMSSSSTNDPYVPCIRGRHALGELVLVQKHPLVEPKEETDAISITPKVQRGLGIMPEAISITPTSSTSTPASSPGYHKRRKRINRRWGNSRGREWKAVAASPTVVHGPSLTVAMQPELDDVEGLLFVSFTSKEALDVHVGDQPANSTPSASPVSLTTLRQLKEKVEVTPETDEEKIAHSEALLLQDLRALRHRQVIHPVLQEVGMKLSSLDPAKAIDLQYLGVHLPLPPPKLPEQGSATALSLADEGLSFISRTGKTSDMTKIKGWKNKFIRNKETSSTNSDGLQKNLSAFCSNMLDEYLESEAQNISERAAAFSTISEDSVAYQLPAKSSSYVKTLDSVLKHRKAAPKVPVRVNRPCPLSHKPLLYSALTSQAPSPTSPAAPVPAAAQSVQQSASTQPGAQRLFTFHPPVSQRPAVSFGQGQGMTHRPTGLTKFQLRLFQMEIGALNQGLNRTQLTPDRLSVALSVILTKQMQTSQMLKVAQFPKHKTAASECGQEFCALGCVCSSLQHPNRGPVHCRRPECMFGCACFKRKITKQMSAGESEEPIQPVYHVTNMEHVIQPHPGSHAKKLWNQDVNDEDPEPLFIPKKAAAHSNPFRVVKRSCVPRPTQPVREEDKDPVYRYLESFMTCARVREFNSKPPPELTIEPKIINISTPNTTAKPKKTTADNLQKNNHSSPTVTKAETASRRTSYDETGAKKQIEIQSACPWDKHRRIVLEALYRRMNQNRLSRRFCVGPYRVCPIAKIFMQKPSGSIVTYRVHISKASKASDNEEEEFDDSDEEEHASKTSDGEVDAEEEEGQSEESHVRFGVTPFLSGVLPAGRLRARTKPVGCQAYGLIQVNGKSYNQARLLLGNMGSLHPANRLAAFVTGRLHSPGYTISLKKSQKSDPTNQITAPGALHIKAAGTVVPPVITARKTSDLKAPTQPPVQPVQPDSWRKGSTNLPKHSQNSCTVYPFVSGPRSSVSAFQNSSTSSPVSLTVSQSLKTPSFLGQSGTYSFRICPPANQSTGGQNLPGVTLPGGFTLIQLPNPGADGAASESVNTTNMAAVDKAPLQQDAFLNSGHLEAQSDANLLGSDTVTEAKDPSSSTSGEPAPKSELMCDKKMPSDEREESNKKVDMAGHRRIASWVSEDLSSDSSDYYGEGDEDDEEVDIETVEEVRQGIAIAQMKEAVRRALMDSRDPGSAKDLNAQRFFVWGQDQMDDDRDECKDKRRKNHTALERQRRSEQRILFDKLQIVLQTDPRTPRLRLLSLALREIQNLVETSRLLEERKRRLMKIQSLYIKQLSFLSGKSETVIKHKLKEICERQKMREKRMKWRPFFSHLLQSRAALLQATTPESKPQPTPLLQPDFFTSLSQADPATIAVQNKIMALIQSNLQRAPAQPSVQTPMPQPVSSPAQAEVTAPSLQGGDMKKEDQQETPIAPPQASVPTSQTECSVAATPQVTAAQDGATPASAQPNSSKPPVRPPQPFALPLIRSKTGRIILPSSLKPLGHGFYTLTVMEPKKVDVDKISSSANKQPSNVDSSKKTKTKESISERDRPLESESSRISQEDKKVQSSDSKPKRSDAASPLAELALLNKKIYVPSVALQPLESTPEGASLMGVNKTLATACLSFNRMKQVPAAAERDPSPPVFRRGRGRPRKHPVTLLSANENRAVVEDTSRSVSESETSVLAIERQGEKHTLELPKTRAEDSPAPVKRGRGRPPKKKPTELWSPPTVQAGSSPSKSSEDSPVRLSHRFKSPDTKPKESPASLGDVNTSRPLTRGALGKDFPSAKKRSWIDVEKELEPELESE